MPWCELKPRVHRLGFQGQDGEDAFVDSPEGFAAGGALEGLQAEGCLPPEDAEVLRQGYLFLRRVENRLRLVHASSLAHMPTSGRPLAQLARRLGVLGSDPGKTFLTQYHACAARVRDVYARVLRASR